MELDLKGKVALVTGGSKGIGLACALALAAEGARVAICSRSSENVTAALAKMPGMIGMTADLSDERQAAAVAAWTESSLGPIGILVNCAGAARQTPPAELTPAAWRAAMDAKYFSYINVIDPVVKLMAGRGNGVIINMLGLGGKVASPTHLAGGAANAALMLATVGLGAAYAPQGVRVVGIHPGLTDTDRVTAGLDAAARNTGISLEQARQGAIGRIPSGRMAHPGDIADAMLFLASARAGYITGVILTVDGGMHPIIV